MSDSDAEWIDVDREFGDPIRPPPPRPFPPDRRRTTTTTTTTEVPRRRPDVGIPSSRHPLPSPDQPHDAPEMLPPSNGANSDALSSGTVMALSVASCVVVVVLVLALFYFLVLKKKLHKIGSPPHVPKRDDYSIRIEDVSHLSIDESDPVYMNTTDLHRLMSSVRLKNKKPPQPITNQNNFPDVVQVVQPILSIPISSEPQVESQAGGGSTHDLSNFTLNRPKVPPPSVPTFVPTSVFSESESQIVRPAPPPPTKICPPTKPVVSNINKTDAENIQQRTQRNVKNNVQTPIVPQLPTSSKPLKSSGFIPQTLKQNKPTQMAPVEKPVPPVLPKPTISRGNSLEDRLNEVPKASKPPPPKVAAKPLLKKKLSSEDAQKPTPPSTLKKPIKIEQNSLKRPTTNSEQSSLKRPILPPLLMNKLIKQSSTESAISTADTICSFVMDTSEVDSEPEPEKMSVKAKRALLENTIHSTERRS